MFCFYYGKLGHESNECIEVSGDSTSEKKYEASLRASPWKIHREQDESMAHGSTADLKHLDYRKILVTKRFADNRRRKLDNKAFKDVHVVDIFKNVSIEEPLQVMVVENKEGQDKSGMIKSNGGIVLHDNHSLDQNGFHASNFFASLDSC